MSLEFQVLLIIMGICMILTGSYMIYLGTRKAGRSLRFGEGQTLRRLNELYDVLNADYIIVYCRAGEDRFYEYGTLYFNPEAKELIVVCDSDHSDFDSEGLVKLDLPLMQSMEVK